ncbi:MAG TPA: YceI family protein [Abditibacterium sp.]|jgi:polyisoprenoid-binding protein YceI
MKKFFRSRRSQIGLAAFALLNFAHAGVMAQDAARVYFANDPVGRNVVAVVSRAPLETMLTRTGAVQAQVKINPQNVLDKPVARFLIDVNSFETGIKMRDEHMKSPEWIDTAKYPTATFTLLKALPPAGTTSIPLSVGRGAMEVEGELEFHGVKKIVRANVAVSLIPETEATKARLAGEMLHITATFPLKLDDFGVKIPEMAKLKIANVQDVQVDVFVSTGSKAPVWAAPVA